MLQDLNRFPTKYQLAVEAIRKSKLQNGLCGSICKPQSVFALDKKR